MIFKDLKVGQPFALSAEFKVVWSKVSEDGSCKIVEPIPRGWFLGDRGKVGTAWEVYPYEYEEAIP